MDDFLFFTNIFITSVTGDFVGRLYRAAMGINRVARSC